MAKSDYDISIDDEFGTCPLVTMDELQKRMRFAAVASAVNTRMHDLTKISQDTIAFNAQKDSVGGKPTMKSYIWSLELDAYDAAHPGD